MGNRQRNIFYVNNLHHGTDALSGLKYLEERFLAGVVGYTIISVTRLVSRTTDIVLRSEHIMCANDHGLPWRDSYLMNQLWGFVLVLGLGLDVN